MTGPATEHIGRLVELVSAEVASIFDSAAFREWANGQTLRAGDLIVLNNSFLFREGIAIGNKNTQYLSIEIDDELRPSSEPRVATVNRINASFKRIPVGQAGQFQLRELASAIKDELKLVGTIIRVLVGRIGDDQPTEVGLERAQGLDRLRYEPRLAEPARISGSVLSVNRLDDIDVVWRAVKQTMSRGGFGGIDQLSEHFDEAFSNLRESAGQPVDLAKVDERGSTILGSVIERFDEQAGAYAIALTTYTARPDSLDAYNELLRIAYNFVDGTRALVTLVVGISDLKPILYWLTVGAQFDLADKFGCLPFSMVGKAKPSLARYRTVISGARNQAFHDVFSFGRPFHARLTGDAFMEPELRLFQEYHRKAPTLDFRDRELVDLLAGFTRVTERAVPLGFWEKNLDVMYAVAEVARALRRALLNVLIVS
jgi:hypothetical protein